jgi:hypothetical protein
MVQKLCQQLSGSSVPKGCLGFILDDSFNLYRNSSADRGCRIQLTDHHWLSLESLLSRPYYRRDLSKEECLLLGANLSSSLLQLHGTPWLSDTWCNKCIYFSQSCPVNVGEPYVMLNFDDPSEASYRPTWDCSGQNPYLVALGIILLELSQKKLFSEWLDSKSISRPDDIISKSARAWDWLRESLMGHGHTISEDYAAVVQLCLFSTFNPVPRRVDLCDEEFREAVYRFILYPLEKEYMTVKIHLGEQLSCVGIPTT